MDDERIKAQAQELLRVMPPSVQYALMAAAASLLPPPPPSVPPLSLPPTPPLIVGGGGGRAGGGGDAGDGAGAGDRRGTSAPPSSARLASSPSSLATPSPAPAGPPERHIFSGTKAPLSECGICGATTTGGGCWRRLWMLAQPTGAWLCGCNRCGLRFRHGKIGPPKTGPLAPAVGWRLAPPPPRMRPVAQQQQQQQQQQQHQQQQQSFGYGYNDDDDDEEEEHEHEYGLEAEEGGAWPESADEAATAAWTLVGMSWATAAS